MNDNGERLRWLSIRNLGIAAAIVLLIAGIAAILLIFSQTESTPLFPLLPTPTPHVQDAAREPQTITFTELNDNPLAYLNQTILVSGEFLPLEQSNCRRTSGPLIQWSLTAENLQLDVLGFERIVQLLPDATPMTIQGTWRLYQGPRGCGKAPPRGSMWFLEAKKIVQPNPLVGRGGQTIPVQIITGQPELPEIIQPDSPNLSDPLATETVIATEVAGTIIPTATPFDQIIPTETPTSPEQITPSPTAPLSPTGTVPTSTQIPDATDPTSTATPTAGPTQDPGVSTPTITAEAPPIPATATDTNGGGGYPGPESTPTPTPSVTPDPYP